MRALLGSSSRQRWEGCVSLSARFRLDHGEAEGVGEGELERSTIARAATVTVRCPGNRTRSPTATATTTVASVVPAAHVQETSAAPLRDAYSAATVEGSKLVGSASSCTAARAAASAAERASAFAPST